MATINLRPHNERASTSYVIWLERNEIIGRIIRGDDDRYRIVPSGVHWSPMKSFAGQSFVDLDGARDEVQRYFERR